MPFPAARFGLAACLLPLALPLVLIAQTPRDTPLPRSATPGTPGPAKPAAPSKYGAPKGPLPDPMLLDGSSLQEEKRPETGMIGEFEMEGSENAQSDKVGGDSQQPAGGGGGTPPPDGQTQNSQGGGASASASAGGGGAQQSEQSAQGGGGSAGSQSQQQGGGQAGGQSIAQGDSGAQPDGTQVGQLSGGDGSGGQNGQSSPSGKPQQVALGDSAMQIKPQGNAPGVVGGEKMQPAGKDVPQQYDARTPGGGQQSGSGKGNQGVEKGRVMPTGI